MKGVYLAPEGSGDNFLAARLIILSVLVEAALFRRRNDSAAKFSILFPSFLNELQLTLSTVFDV